MDMTSFILSPPIAFLILFATSALELWLLRSLTVKGTESAGKRKPYACGEDIVHHRLQPDYSQFFSLAFFFTIMHVVAMVICTVPAGSVPASLLAVTFTLSAAVGLAALFRKDPEEMADTMVPWVPWEKIPELVPHFDIAARRRRFPELLLSKRGSGLVPRMFKAVPPDPRRSSLGLLTRLKQEVEENVRHRN